MATLSTGALTLADWAKRQDPQGKIPVVAELLSQRNEVLEDAVFMEGNLPTGHRSIIRTGLPAVYWRSVNSGVPSSKSTTRQVDDACGMLEAFCRVDKDLAELNGELGAFRLSEDKAFLEAMNQTQASTLFYGNPATDNRQYLGLANRYGTISGAANGQNILDAGGTGSVNTSIWLVVWGDNTVFCPFPKGTRAGLIHNDDGLLTVYDATNNPYKAYQTHYQWKNGLVVKDWRYVVRICNIDTTISSNNIAADLIALMSRALDRIPSFNEGRAAFYMNRTLYSILRLQALNKTMPSALTIEKGLNQFGTPQTWASFEGVPLRRVDQLLNTESRVV